MCLIGLSGLAVVSTIAFIRSTKPINKLAVSAFFVTVASYMMGVGDVFLP